MNRVLFRSLTTTITRRLALAILLKAAGFHEETAFGGQEALRKAEQFEPDACLVDIRMPGMNGYELARHLKAHPMSSGVGDHDRVR